MECLLGVSRYFPLPSFPWLHVSLLISAAAEVFSSGSTVVNAEMEILCPEDQDFSSPLKESS